jgi:FKBP-type peptidyl-prolyl cis-trans isomerase
MKRWYIISVPLIALCALHGYKKTHNAHKSHHKSHNNTSVSGERKNHMSVETTASGLQYQILNEGAGSQPKAGQKVTVHYTGWLSNNGQPGAKFDSSVDRGMPFAFVVGIGHVIKGWDEGLLLMRVGEKRRLIIPSNLGYGARGAGGVIPPHATLIFDVELLSIG